MGVSRQFWSKSEILAKKSPKMAIFWPKILVLWQKIAKNGDFWNFSGEKGHYCDRFRGIAIPAQFYFCDFRDFRMVILIANFAAKMFLMASKTHCREAIARAIIFQFFPFFVFPIFTLNFSLLFINIGPFPTDLK